jgi:transcriptional regulator with XRE-family HTH domain
MDLGKNIQKYRKEAGLTQRELAELLDVAVGTIQQYELGKRQPRLEMINRIAAALGIGIRRLYPDFQMEDWKETETYKNAQLKNKLDPLRNDLIAHFQELNEDGKTEAVKRVQELTEIPRYKYNPEDNTAN